MYHSFFIYKMSACPAEHCKGGEGWTVEKEGKRDCCVLISWVSARCQLLWGISITTTCREGGGSIVLTCRWGYITVFHLGLPDFAVMLIWGCDCQDNWSCLKLTGGSVLKKKKKQPICQCRRHRSDPWVKKIPLEKEMAAHSNILGWEVHMDRGAWRATYSSWGLRVGHDLVTRQQ